MPATPHRTCADTLLWQPPRTPSKSGVVWHPTKDWRPFVHRTRTFRSHGRHRKVFQYTTPHTVAGHMPSPRHTQRLSESLEQSPLSDGTSFRDTWGDRPTSKKQHGLCRRMRDVSSSNGSFKRPYGRMAPTKDAKHSIMVLCRQSWDYHTISRRNYGSTHTPNRLHAAPRCRVRL